MSYTVYILYSGKYQKIYIGSSSHLINRFHSHNFKGTKDWTKNFRPWLVIYCEFYENKSTALKREKQLKSAVAREIIWTKIGNEFNQKGNITNL